MPPVKFSQGALRDLQRLREFLKPKSPDAAARAAQAIRQGVRVLGQQPAIGRPIEDLPEVYREWLIDFGDSGYVARYRMGPDEIVILALRHQKEAGF